MVWNDKLKKEIPEGWDVRELLDLIEWKSSSQPPKSDFVEQYKKNERESERSRDV